MCAECQVLAWKAGHKRECVPAAEGRGNVMDGAARVQGPGARRGTPTAEQMRLCERIVDLSGRQDWRGLAALDDEACAVARQAPPFVAGEI